MPTKRKILEDLTTTTAPVPQSLGAAATPAAAIPADVDEEPESTKKAEHGYIDVDGNPTDDDDLAWGITYTLLDDDGSKLEPVVVKFADASDFSKRTAWNFGMKTLCTNVASGVRSNKKLPPQDRVPSLQREAVVERLALIQSGQWIDRTREPGQPRVNKEHLAGAAVDYRLAEGKITAADVDAEYARIRQRLEEDLAYLKKVRAVPQVAAFYAKRTSGESMSVDEI